ncbi:hypothetical protein [Altibacter sp. HG106]|uniref:hypothetical protein n=1 Tax=Altibacter sp. HG106 TaxID=3023937 RepID=UPI002350D76B|nr:hypothetical protein [Altibacter sp. HG106]MDC7993611.1 hypothetical protein [Altibacter sp. HG106]
MTKPNSKSTKQTSSSLVRGSVIALVIALTPYLFYTYESFPQTKVWETFLFTYESNWYQKVHVSVWTMMGKFIPLLLLFLWFFTCKHWWFHVILIPIGMFTFQLISVINDDVSFVDEVEIWWLLPIMLTVVPFVYLIRAKLFAKIRGTDLKDFEKELQQKRSFWEQLKDLFR